MKKIQNMKNYNMQTKHTLKFRNTNSNSTSSVKFIQKFDPMKNLEEFKNILHSRSIMKDIKLNNELNKIKINEKKMKKRRKLNSDIYNNQEYVFYPQDQIQTQFATTINDIFDSDDHI